jgi:GT2 family glycosyltransferase
MPSTGSPAVTVITLTYKRAADLAAALPALLAAIADHPEADLLVVDNDVVPSARPVVDEFHSERLRYVHEPRPGIAAARNRGLDETTGSGAIIFIDDDETPCPGWLDRLLDAYRTHKAEAVAGPVLSEFEGPLDPWIAAGRYFDRLRHPSGTVVEVAATNNLLLDRAFVSRHGLRFDEAFGLSGGSDSVFTRQLRHAGGRIVWCDEAVVTDRVPAARATRKWVVQRAFRMGNTEARARIYTAAGTASAVRERLRALGSGLARVGAGAVGLVGGVLTRSLPARSRGVRTTLRGAGMVLAAFGYSYFEYRRRPAKPTAS